MVNIGPGDRFVITGPRQLWNPSKVGGWQPRAWTSHPEDPDSKPIRSNEVWINFGQEFVALEVRACARHRFQSVKVDVNFWRGDVWACDRQVWINVSREGQPWARVLRQVAYKMRILYY